MSYKIWYLALVAMASVLKEGIALPDLWIFLDTPKGHELVEQSYVLAVGKGDVAFVPYGYVPIPLTASVESRPLETGHLVATTYYNVELAKQVAEPVWVAIKKFNDEYFDKCKLIEGWTKRKELFETFVSEVAK